MSTDLLVKQNHYKEASNIYDTGFFNTGEYEAWQLDIVLKTLDLNETDRLADIGGGTGRFASLIYKTARLKYPVTCVDPSPNMLSQAKDLQGVNTVCCGAVEFASRNDDITFDRILMKAMVHHLSEDELKATFSSLINKLSKQG